MKQLSIISLFKKLLGYLSVFMIVSNQACKDNIELEYPAEKNSEKIHFAVQIMNSSDESSKLLGGTRRNNGNGSMALSSPVSRTNFITQFTQGDSIGVFAVPANQPLSASGNLIHNAKLTLDGNTWQGNVKWEPEVESLDFYAYFPYDSKITDPTNFKFEVKENQSNLADFSSSDLMSAKQTAVIRGSMVNLNFKHVLSLIQVEFPATNVNGNKPDPSLEIILNRLQYSGTYNLSNQQFSTNSNSFAGIRPYWVGQSDPSLGSSSFTYRALVPAQTILADQALIFLRQGKSTSVTKQKNTLQLNPANVYRFSIDDFPTTDISTVLIKAGTFLMGNPDPLASENEKPLHWVKLTKDFYMSKYEVTIQQYADFLNANNVKHIDGFSPNFNGSALFSSNGQSSTVPIYDINLQKWKATTGFENYPMSMVYPHGAISYCNWVGGMLPTEAQWEYACRAGTSTPYFFGNDVTNLNDYGWLYDNSSEKLHPVGQKLPNPFGLYDMYGNVDELTLDRNSNNQLSSYPEAPTLETALVDPISTNGNYLVLRGSSIRSTVSTSFNRDLMYYLQANSWSGFRVVFEK